MTPTLEGLSLQVTDIERSIAFYLRIPGAAIEAQRPGQFARIRIGTGYVHLVQAARHAFHIELNVDDIDAAYLKLREAGLEPSKPLQHPWGKSDFRLVDPDGNALEFGAAK